MDRLADMTRAHWLGLYGGIALAWAALWWAASGAPSGEWLAALCRATPDAAGFAGALAMWALMGAAMMLPTALPAFAAHDMVPGARGGAWMVAGYAVVWLGFAALAAGAQVGLAGLGLVGATGVAVAPVAVALLLAAALYQVSPLKEACLSRCRQPATFLMAHWDDGPWRMGLRLGATCLGCCWALMLLGFVGGMASLGLMALATGVMMAEKLSAGPWVQRFAALGCLGGAGWILGGTG